MLVKRAGSDSDSCLEAGQLSLHGVQQRTDTGLWWYGDYSREVESSVA